MLTLLPIVFLLLLTAAILGPAAKTGPAFRPAFLTASLWTGTLVLAIAELLSLDNALTGPAIAAVWVLAVVGSGLGLYARRPLLPRSDWQSWSGTERALLAAILALVIMIGITAWTAPPNTADGMTYHMSRVAHWIQNRSIHLYPTHNLRQLHLPPFAELSILHLQLLSGGDRFANLIQWGFMVGSLLGVSLVAAQLGASRCGQLLSALAAVTLPMGVLQGSSVQNDWVVSFWLLCFISAVLRFRHQRVLAAALGAGLALGLALLTKPTAFLFALPFGLWLAGLAWERAVDRQQRLRQIGLVSVVLVVAVAVNAPHWARNVALLGSPLVGAEEPGPHPHRYDNEILGPTVVVSNLARNLALHAGTPSPRLNGLVVRALRILHRPLRLGLNDPRTTWLGTQFTLQAGFFHEDANGNPLHLLITIACLVGLVGFRQRPGRGLLLLYALSVAAGFVLFCTVLRWQPWHSRLHLPLFVALTPILGTLCSKHRLVVLLLAGILAVGATRTALGNFSRPWRGERSIFRTPRAEQYFANRSHLQVSYLEVAKLVSEDSCRKVGLMLGGDGYEYPLWALLDDPDRRAVERRIEHVGVTNQSRGFSGAIFSSSSAVPFHPCLVIAAEPETANVTVGGTRFQRVESKPTAGGDELDDSGELGGRTVLGLFQAPVRTLP